MKKPYVIIATACLVYTAAWFLPVIKGGVTLPEGLPGWEAFTVAAAAITGRRDVSFSSWYGQLLSALSAASTVAFAVLATLGMLLRNRAVHRAFARVAAVCFLINTHWFVFDGFGQSVKIGYYLWWWSFLILAIGLFALARAEETKQLKARSAAA